MVGLPSFVSVIVEVESYVVVVGVFTTAMLSSTTLEYLWMQRPFDERLMMPFAEIHRRGATSAEILHHCESTSLRIFLSSA